MKIGDIVYYAQILKETQVFEVLELRVRTVTMNGVNDWFVGVEKRTKHAYSFKMDRLNEIVFYDRLKALELVNEAEDKYKKNDKMEI